MGEQRYTPQYALHVLETGEPLDEIPRARQVVLDALARNEVDVMDRGRYHLALSLSFEREPRIIKLEDLRDERYARPTRGKAA